MTPKQKAKDLIDSFYWELEDDSKAIQCATIAVDEILFNEEKMLTDLSELYHDEYWTKVKQEIKIYETQRLQIRD